MIEVKSVYKKEKGKVLGSALIDFHGICFFVNVVNGRDGLFLGYPSRYNETKKEWSEVLTVSFEVKEEILILVKREFDSSDSTVKESKPFNNPNPKPVKESNSPVKNHSKYDIDEDFDDDIPF